MRIAMTILACLLITFTTEAQTYKDGLSYKFMAIDYETPLSDNFEFDTDRLNYGVDISYRRMLSNSFDLSIPFRFGAARFPVEEGEGLIKKQELFLGLDATIQYHFANGYILPQDSRIRPYLLTGFGATYIPNYDNKVIGNIPLGLGLDVPLTDAILFTTQAEYRFLQDESYVYTAGLKFLLNEATPKELPTTLDSDFDGIIDSEDYCPMIAGSKENGGCPIMKPAEVDKFKFATKKVEFEFGKSKLKASSYPVLNEVAAIMKIYSNYDLSIEGHTDEVDTKAFNQKLSVERAKACYDYLIKQGVPRDQMSFSGYGETKPIDTNDTDAGRQNNRRVEFKITKR